MAMKFRAHDTFFIRKGWLSKGMKYVQKKPDVFVAKDENPMDVLGIGANMVKALRYWLQAVGLTEEPSSGKPLHLSELVSLQMIATYNNWGRYNYSIIGYLQIKMRQLRGIFSLMSLI